MWSQIAQFDKIRSLQNGSIAATYNAVGTPFAFAPRIICITNNTDGDMFFSNDGTNDNLFIPKNSFKLFDISTNKGGYDGIWCLPVGTQMYVRYNTAPTTGAVYIELLYGIND